MQRRPGVHKLYRVAFWTLPFLWSITLVDKEMATHSSILAWRIPWTEESMGSQRVGHDWATNISPWYLLGPWGFSFGPLARKLGHYLPCSAMYLPWQCLCPHTCIKWRKNKERIKSSSGSLHTLETSLIGKEGSFPSVLSVFGLSHVGNFWKKGRKYLGDFLPTLSKH